VNRLFTAPVLPFACALALSGCGGDEPSGPDTTSLVGEWELTLEDGVAPSGYASTMTIQGNTFTSTFDSPSQSCSWSGTLSSTATEIAWTTNSATAFPCTISVGTTLTSTWTLSNGGDTLTLDFTADGGTLQVWSKT
jgi:hypothetical protein